MQDHAPANLAAPGVSDLDRVGLPYRGQVVYLYAYDVASEMRRGAIPSLLGQPVSTFSMEVGKRGPRDVFFFQPLMALLPPVTWESPLGPVQVQRSVKLFSVGAISLAFRVPFQVDSLESLVPFHELGLAQQEARQLARQVVEDLRPYLIQPLTELREEEAYTVFCLEWPSGHARMQAPSAQAWLDRHRHEVAALLTQETDHLTLAAQEIHETTGRALSYYAHDLAVMDWDAALLIDRPGQFDPTLHIFELANVQLTELEAYDRMLDRALQRAYSDVSGPTLRSRRTILRTLRELRVDMARLSDELSNITKFFGDWHLARVYQSISDRLHLGDWGRTLEGKLRTLDDLYRILRQDQMNIWMMTLEAAIVLLFIIDLIALFAGR